MPARLPLVTTGLQSDVPGAAIEDHASSPRLQGGWLGDVLPCLPVVIVFALCVVLFQAGGGFAPATWYPAALFCLGAVVVTALGAPDLSLPGRTAKIAGGALCAYTGWAYLSILWADVRADAWQGANLTLFYLLAFIIAAVWRIRIKAGELIVLGYAAGIACVGLVVLWSAAQGSVDPNEEALLGGRLAGPTSYPNATSAAFVLALWPALAIALEQRVPLKVRMIGLWLTAALAELSLMCQSRGSVFTLPVVALVFVVLARRRLLAVVVMSAVALTVVVVAPTLLAVYEADSAVGRQDALLSAVIAILVSATVLAALGGLLPLLDRAPRPSGRFLLALRLAIALVSVAVAVGVLAMASPQARLAASWESFREGGVPSGSTHFSGLGSNRYDFWRVGLTEFRNNPVQGIGVDNFVVPYLQVRESGEQPLYPHSLVVRALSQTGIVGTVLLAVFLGAAASAALRQRTPRARALIGGLLAGVAAWLLHGLADWLWEMPALGLMAFALLGLAVGLDRTPSPRWRDDRVRAPWARVAVLVTSVGVILASTITLALPWLSVRYEQRALERWRDDFPGALAMLNRAAALNPLSDRAYVLAGAIASRRGDAEVMREKFERAVARNPSNWYAQLELAVAASALDDRSAALRAARTAYRLNPREEMTLRVLRGIERGQPLSPADVDREFASEAEVG